MKRYLLITFFLSLSTLLSAQNWDINLLRDINLKRDKQADNFFKATSNSMKYVCFSTPVIITGIGLLTRNDITLDKGLVTGAALAISGTISIIMKYGINRTRPFVKYPDLENLTAPSDPSFPSGHTSAAFATATALSLAYPKWYVIVPAYSWAGLVGYSRMDMGVHYPSDVLGGIITGMGSAYLSWKINKWFTKKYWPSAYEQHK
ncbi:MAG: phosphatase PAP2 family protein [Bacteroidota bacterium]|nr:phosphatase PAP2 family protein [Bacteroidota bacterium]MDP4272791.1 phosphatase PAP2 family protein [Bacteroidota bacterium]